MARRHYSDADRAAALAVYDATASGDGRMSKAAREAGVPRQSLMHWVEDRDRAAPPELRQEVKESLSAVFERIARRALEQAEAALTSTASPSKLRDYMLAAAIATDKHQLLGGQPTQRIAMTEEQRVERAAKILSMAAEREKRAARG